MTEQSGSADQMAKLNADSQLPRGRFLSLGDKGDQSVLDAALVRQLAANRTFSAEDAEIVGEVLRSLDESGALPFNWGGQNSHFLRTHGSETWVDYLIYRYKFELYPKQHRVADFPVYLLIEPVSACNLRCVMCFQSDGSFARKPYWGVMDPALFRDVVDQAVAGGTRAVTLASRGEPTLHKNFAELLDYASGKFFELKVNTNAMLLDEKMAHAILSSGVDQLVFSVDAHEKELYERIRVRGKFEVVLENIRRFHEIRAKYYPNSKLETRISGVYFDPAQDVDGFKTFWGDIVDQVGYVLMIDRENTYENAPQVDAVEPCHYLWERMYVWFDGKCNPCDADYKSYLAVGETSRLSLRDIWHGEAFTRLRQAHVEGRRGAFNPCDRCGI